MARNPRDGEEGVRWPGFIAEEADDVGLSDFVTYDQEGPESFSYATFAAVGHQVLIQDLYSKIEELELVVKKLSNSSGSQ